MTIAPDEPVSMPDEGTPEESGSGPSEVPPVTEPDLEGDAETVAPDPVEDA